MARKYYSILAKPPGHLWSIQFGDYDKETVHEEMRDMKDHVGKDCEWEKGTKFKIITTGDKRKDIEAAVEKLNLNLLIDTAEGY